MAEGLTRALERNGVDWRLELTEIGQVPGAERYFDLKTDEHPLQFEAEAKGDPARFLWRPDQINIYVFNSMTLAGGLCAFPATLQGLPQDTIFINGAGILNGAVGWLHEIGHYLSLTHTFQTADLGAVDQNVCTGVGAFHRGAFGQVQVAHCPDNCPDGTNVMSYRFLAVEAATLSRCQVEQMRFELSSQGARGFVLRADRGDPDVAADADDDGIVDLADALLVLDHSLGRPLAGVAPLGLCGLDRTDDDALSCRGQEICSGGNVRPRAVRVGLLPAADNVIASDSLDPSFAARVRADTALAVGSNFGADAYGHRIEHHNRTALAFELGRLHGLRVRRAFLRLRVRTPADVSGVEYAAHPLAGPWSPRTLTFENAPPFLTTAEARAVAPARTGAAMVFDVTEMVRRWVAGDLRNHGLLVRELVDERPAGEAMENRTTVFDSVDRYLGDDTRPRLFVELY